jgi:hypothetical protein
MSVAINPATTPVVPYQPSSADQTRSPYDNPVGQGGGGPGGGGGASSLNLGEEIDLSVLTSLQGAGFGTGSAPVLEAPSHKINSADIMNAAQKALGSSALLSLHANIAQQRATGVSQHNQAQAAVQRLEDFYKVGVYKAPSFWAWCGHFFDSLANQFGTFNPIKLIVGLFDGSTTHMIGKVIGLAIGGLASALYEFVLLPYVEGPLNTLFISLGMSADNARALSNFLVQGVVALVAIVGAGVAGYFAGGGVTGVIDAVQGATAGLSAGIMTEGVVTDLVNVAFCATSVASAVMGGVSFDGISLLTNICKNGFSVDALCSAVPGLNSGVAHNTLQRLTDGSTLREVGNLIGGVADAAVMAYHGFGDALLLTNPEAAQQRAQQREAALDSVGDYYSKQWGNTRETVGSDLIFVKSAAEAVGNTLENFANHGADQFTHPRSHA